MAAQETGRLGVPRGFVTPFQLQVLAVRSFHVTENALESSDTVHAGVMEW